MSWIRRSIGFALPVAALLSASCAHLLQPPAAVVNGTEISIDRLESEIEVGLALSGAPGDQEASADFTRQVLGVLIQFQLVSEFAEEHAIGVTQQEVEEQLAALADRFGGRPELDRALSSRGLDVDEVRRSLQRVLLLDKVGQAVSDLGLAPAGDVPAADAPVGAINPIGVRLSGGSRDEQQAFQRWLLEQLETADIRVSHRFGRLDRSRGAIVEIRSTADLQP